MAGSTDLLRTIHRYRRLLATLHEQADRIPRQIKARRTHFDTQETAYKDEEKALEQLQVTIRDKESELKATHGLIEKYYTQQQSSTSKKEFDAFNTEIKTTTEKGKTLEEEIFNSMEDWEARTEALPGKADEVEELRKATAAFEEESKVKEVELRKEMEEVQGKLAEVEADLPKEISDRYERVVRAKGHDGFASVDSRTCTGCSMQMTAQDFNELLIGHVVICRSCERFLYLPE